MLKEFYNCIFDKEDILEAGPFTEFVSIEIV